MRHSRRLFGQKMLAVAASPVVFSLPSVAAAYPEKAITFICPWPAGGTADQTMRALCAAAGKELGQSIVVENKVGASGMIGLKALTSAKPDGYTIGQIPISVTRFSQLGSVAIDPLKDLTYIARTSGQTFGMATLSGNRWKNLQELVAEARANPGKLVSHPSHFSDPERVAPLRTVYDALRSINVRAALAWR